MKKNIKSIILSLFALIITFSCKDDNNTPSLTTQERVLIANRGGGSITIIDAVTNNIIDSIKITSPSKGEPMYIVYADSKVFVGDRANKVVRVYNPANFAEIKTIACGNGIFHMWADPQAKQLWVNNDIDNTITVIDIPTLTVKSTINIGIKPHDVILSKDGNSAFVSIFSGNADPDSIFKYSTSTFAITAKKAVGKDPHVSVTNDKLYVANQSGTVMIFNQSDLSSVKTPLAIPNAHGAFMSHDFSHFYVTNIAGGGTDGLMAINTTSNEIITAATANTPVATPHNIVINSNSTKLFVTHSGASATAVTIYSLAGAGAKPTLIKTLTTGLNPFGLAYYKRTF